MTKYIVEWTYKDCSEVKLETISKGKAFKKAWELKYDDDVIKVNVYEIHTYCFKNEEE